MAKIKLQAKERKIFGRKVKQLRKAGFIPANVFGPKTKSKALTLNKSDFLKVFDQAGETNLVTLEVEGEKSPRQVLISNLHLHPVTGEILHVDLHQVDLKAKTTANIPIEIVGESPAAKAGGVVVTLLKEVEVEALPTDLPDKIEVDISSLKEVGDSIMIKDLSIDTSKITLQADPEEQVVAIQEQQEEEETPASTEETSESETSGEEQSESQPTEKLDESSDTKSANS